jgi:CDP-diacylglycerol---serine O-phosphatidyltransferase
MHVGNSSAIFVFLQHHWPTMSLKISPMKLKYYIPNTITLMNLSSGFISVIMVFEGQLVKASLFIFLAAIFDFLDGTAARVLDARSELGKQLDSLADIVSFGVAPGIIMFQLLSVGCEGSCNILERMHITPYFALLIPVCSAIRLGKFNIDTRQEENFTGLPTPANAIFFASVPLVVLIGDAVKHLLPLDFLVAFFSNTRSLAILTVLFSYLLISDFRMFSMKFKSLELKGNEHKYIFLLGSLILVVLFSINAIPLIILLYFLLSLVFQRRLAG